jgi:hypothetical protein
MRRCARRADDAGLAFGCLRYRAGRSASTIERVGGRHYACDGGLRSPLTHAPSPTTSPRVRNIPNACSYAERAPSKSDTMRAISPSRVIQLAPPRRLPVWRYNDAARLNIFLAASTLSLRSASSARLKRQLATPGTPRLCSYSDSARSHACRAAARSDLSIARSPRRMRQFAAPCAYPTCSQEQRLLESLLRGTRAWARTFDIAQAKMAICLSLRVSRLSVAEQSTFVRLHRLALVIILPRDVAQTLARGPLAQGVRQFSIKRERFVIAQLRGGIISSSKCDVRQFLDATRLT